MVFTMKIKFQSRNVKPNRLQKRYVNRTSKRGTETRRKNPIIVIMIHYAPKFRIYTFCMHRNQTLKRLKRIHVT